MEADVGVVALVEVDEQTGDPPEEVASARHGIGAEGVGGRPPLQRVHRGAWAGCRRRRLGRLPLEGWRRRVVELCQRVATSALISSHRGHLRRVWPRLLWG